MDIFKKVTRSGGAGCVLAALLTAACSPGLELASDERKLIDPKTHAVKSTEGSPLVLKKFSDLIAYGVGLSETYVSAADKVAAGQDAAAFGIIASAATAVGGLAFGAPAAVSGGAGLAGGVLAAGAQYANGPAAIKAMLTASTQVSCVVRAGQASLPFDEAYDFYSGYDRQRMAIIQSGYITARIELRRALIRELPDFAGTFTALQSAAKAAGPQDEPLGGPATRSTRSTEDEVRAANKQMQVNVAACFLPAPLVEAAKKS